MINTPAENFFKKKGIKANPLLSELKAKGKSVLFKLPVPDPPYRPARAVPAPYSLYTVCILSVH